MLLLLITPLDIPSKNTWALAFITLAVAPNLFKLNPIDAVAPLKKLKSLLLSTLPVLPAYLWPIS